VKNRAVFLDRDGTINIDTNYVKNEEELILYPFAAKAIKMLNNTGYLVIIVTNQSGISRGYLNHDTLSKIHEKLEKELYREEKAKIDKIYYCPSHPDENSRRRKPAPGMIEEAQKDFNIDLSQSFIIGDKISDIELGINTGIKPILVLTGKGEEEYYQLKNKRYFKKVETSDNILKAVEYILQIKNNT
jgi:histidinol-phosphate phosphatase family protein